MKRGRFTRLILCIPLIWVMALWAFSYSTHERLEKMTSQHLYWALSSQGQLHLEMDDLDIKGPDSALIGQPVKSLDAPWWAIWVTTTLVTLCVHVMMVRSRKPAQPA